MEILILIVAMILVGLIMGAVARAIWKDDPPMGVQGTIIVSVVTAVAVGLLDWYVIPAMGFSNTMKVLGVAIEPALSVLLVLWIIRRARK